MMKHPSRYLPVIIVMVITSFFAISGTISAWNRDIQVKRSDMKATIGHNLEKTVKAFDSSKADTASLGDFWYANRFLSGGGTPEDYDRFSNELDLLLTNIMRSDPHVKQLWTVSRVESAQRSDFHFDINTIASDGTFIRESDLPEYYPIIGVAPSSKYSNLLGLDVYSDPVIAAAMDRARDSGKPVFSDRIGKAYTGLDDYFYVVVSPVYLTSGVPGLVSHRRRAIIGFGMETQSLPELFDASARPLAAEGLNTYVFEIIPEQKPELIYSYPRKTNIENAEDIARSYDREFIFTETVDLNGRAWKIFNVPSSSDYGYPKPSVWMPAILGLFFLGMLSIYLTTSVKRTLELERTQHALMQAYSDLSVWADKAEERTHLISLLSEMAEVLQSCLNTDEAYQTISKFLPRLFKNTSGALYIISDPKGPAFAVVDWGDSPPLERAFTYEDCLARRRGKTFSVDDAKNELVCEHVKASLPGSYACVPMVAQGRPIGLLHICTVEPLSTIQKELSTTVAEHVAMAIANIELRDQIREQSISDPLTKLFNRRFMDDTLEREIRRATRNKTKLSVIMVDIDFFKNFNDDYGHDAGDIILKTLAHFLKTSIRLEDFACRYGGEEFLLILPGASLENAVRRADQLRTDVRFLTIEHEDQVLGPIAVSAGVATFPDNAGDKERLVTAADKAMFKAKKSGRNRVVAAAKIRKKRSG